MRRQTIGEQARVFLQLPWTAWASARSLATAVAARLVARHLGAHPDDAYAAGMLHHVGDLVLYRRDPQRHAEVQAAATPPHGRGPVWDRESEAFGKSHLEMGSTVLRDWLLPDRIVAAVREHHAQPEALSSTLSRAVWLGARIAALAVRVEPLDGLSMHAACLAAGLDGHHGRLRDELDSELATAVERVAAYARTQTGQTGRTGMAGQTGQTGQRDGRRP